MTESDIIQRLAALEKKVSDLQLDMRVLSANAPSQGGGDPATLTDAQNRLLDKLREWRKQKAQEEGHDAYRVLSNHLLTEIAKATPTSYPEFQAIRGIGPDKTIRYGDAVVSLVNKHLAGGQPAQEEEPW